MQLQKPARPDLKARGMGLEGCSLYHAQPRPCQPAFASRRVGRTAFGCKIATKTAQGLKWIMGRHTDERSHERTPIQKHTNTPNRQPERAGPPAPRGGARGHTRAGRRGAGGRGAGPGARAQGRQAGGAGAPNRAHTPPWDPHDAAKL